jgi:hypothetical protein
MKNETTPNATLTVRDFKESTIPNTLASSMTGTVALRHDDGKDKAAQSLGQRGGRARATSLTKEQAWRRAHSPIINQAEPTVWSPREPESR